MGHVPALVCVARSVSAVGQGVDLALARAELLEAPPKPRGVKYAPSPEGRLAFGVPWRGGFDALLRRYRRERARIAVGRVATGIEVSARSEQYRSELELPRVRWAAFSLRTRDDRPLIFDGTRGARVAAMVRHAVHGAAKCAGLDERAISELMGHGGDERIEAQPLPNVGYRHADGRIRRVLVVAPWTVAEDAWRSVESRLVGAELVVEAGKVPARIGGPRPQLSTAQVAPLRRTSNGSI